MVERVMTTAASQVGIDLNAVATNTWQAAPLQYIPGCVSRAACLAWVPACWRLPAWVPARIEQPAAHPVPPTYPPFANPPRSTLPVQAGPP
jgi:hypothetical protein